MESRYGWVLVALGGLMGCVAVGAMFSLAVFLEPMSQDTGWGRAGISSAMSLNFIAMGLGSFGWGMASDKWGARRVVLIGSAILGLALVAASQAQTLGQFQLTFGILVGAATSAFFAPMIATVTGWFDRNRALAVSLVSAGVGMAPLTMSPLAQWMVTTHGWRPAMFVIGLLAWAVLLPAAWLVRTPKAPQAVATEPARAAAEATEGSAARALRSPQFIVLALTFTACCAAHSGPIFHMVSYAMFCGVAPMAAVSIYSVEGLAGLGGRILLGVLADRYGAKLVLVAGLVVQAFAISAYAYVSALGQFYALAVVFGMAYGGVMPLYSVLARGYFSQNIMGTVLGAATMLSCIGMSLGPLAGGWVFDRFGTYAWLFMGSGAVALGAVAIALAFPPLPRPRMPAPEPQA
ncbi:MAG TPA: MFS transporter, partial [Usitatibacter sp.]|nr:MFS transporter [Usitatibacter sp.]